MDPWAFALASGVWRLASGVSRSVSLDVVSGEAKVRSRAKPVSQGSTGENRSVFLLKVFEQATETCLGKVADGVVRYY